MRWSIKNCEAQPLDRTEQSQGWVLQGKKATFASGKPLVLSLSPHWAFVQFLSFICGNLPVSLLLFPHRKGSSPGTGRGSSPRCQIQPVTQARAEAVSWIYFGYQASLLPCFHLSSCSWEGSAWSLHGVVLPTEPHSRHRSGDAGWGHVGPARTGPSGMWPRIGSTESRQPLACSSDQSHYTELANPSTAGIWASDESTEPCWLSLCSYPSS